MCWLEPPCQRGDLLLARLLHGNCFGDTAFPPVIGVEFNYSYSVRRELAPGGPTYVETVDLGKLDLMILKARLDRIQLTLVTLIYREKSNGH